MEGSLLSYRKLIIGASIASLVTFTFTFFKTFNSSKSKQEQEKTRELNVQEEEISRQLNSLTELQAQLAQKAAEFELKYLKNAPHVLTASCLREIFEFTPSIVDKQELQSIYFNNRKARRSVFTFLKERLSGQENAQLETYYRFVCTFEEQLQYLIEKTQKDYVVFLNLDYAVITDSIDFHLCQPETGFAEWIKNWSLQIKEQLKEKLLLYGTPVTPQIVLEIVKFQIQCLGSESTRLVSAIRSLNLESEDEQQSVPTFLQSYLQDEVFLKYGIEIEQVNIAQQDLTEQLSEKLHILSQLQNSVLGEMLSGEQDLAHSEGSMGSAES